MDLDLMKVVDVHLVQSNEAGNSVRMEKEGFLQSLNFIRSQNLTITEFVSDRRRQIVKYMREEMGDTRHSIDAWHVSKGSKLSLKLCEILESRQLSKDIPMLSTGPQTAAIEWFHSVLNHLAPKMIGFHYEGLLHRCILAAMHFNENTNRQQAETRGGKQCFKLSFRKAKKDFTLQQVTVDCTFGYVDGLMTAVFDCASNASSIREMDENIRQNRTTHLPLSSEYARPDKEQAISVFKSRFK